MLAFFSMAEIAQVEAALILGDGMQHGRPLLWMGRQMLRGARSLPRGSVLVRKCFAPIQCLRG
ncbi:hypothetical protein AOX63_00275 [Pseudomonas sp. ADP]|nr:hypothetical protein AOX63_00275 [Pseudomonas sp. ADP]OBP12055.1 hypothetical protein BAE52_05830 [Pseudomonas sp. EGD-AKN5]